VHSLHEKYGDVVRLTPSRVSFTHPDAWNAIRGHRKAGQGENGKDPLFYAMTRQNILGANRADHNRFRRILAHGFSAKAMQDQQPLITKYVDLLIARLRERTGSQKEENGQTKQPRPAVVDLAAWFNFTTFDVIGDLSFGEPFGCLESSQYHPWVYAILNGVKQFGPIMAIRFHFPPVLFDLIRVLSRVSPKSYFGKHWETQTEFARQKIAKRRRLGESRPDFAEAMLKAKSDDGRMLTEEELASNARLLVLAGSETTATALTGAAYFLATHPDVQRKLAEEVRSSFKAEGDIDYFSVNQLKYMLAVLDESMRMYPPVPSNLPRVCMPGGDVILGYRVPEGVSFPSQTYHVTQQLGKRTTAHTDVDSPRYLALGHELLIKKLHLSQRVHPRTLARPERAPGPTFRQGETLCIPAILCRTTQLHWQEVSTAP
jgi:cytochrome P450